jgi:hypothetical protein
METKTIRELEALLAIENDLVRREAVLAWWDLLGEEEKAEVRQYISDMAKRVALLFSVITEEMQRAAEIIAEKLKEIVPPYEALQSALEKLHYSSQVDKES